MALQAPVTNHQTSVKQADEEVSTTGGLQHVSLPPPPPPPPLSVSSGFSSCFSVAYSRFCVDLEFFGNMLGIFDMGQGREGGREGGRKRGGREQWDGFDVLGLFSKDFSLRFSMNSSWILCFGFFLDALWILALGLFVDSCWILHGFFSMDPCL